MCLLAGLTCNGTIQKGYADLDLSASYSWEDTCVWVNGDQIGLESGFGVLQGMQPGLMPQNLELSESPGNPIVLSCPKLELFALHHRLHSHKAALAQASRNLFHHQSRIWSMRSMKVCVISHGYEQCIRSFMYTNSLAFQLSGWHFPPQVAAVANENWQRCKCM